MDVSDSNLICHEAAVKVLVRITVILRLSGSRPASKLIHRLHQPLGIALSIGQLTIRQLVFLRASEWKSERGHPRHKPKPFCNLISEVTLDQLCCILFVWSESRGPAHIQAEGAGRPECGDHWGPFHRLPSTGSEQVIQSKTTSLSSDTLNPKSSNSGLIQTSWVCRKTLRFSWYYNEDVNRKCANRW